MVIEKATKKQKKEITCTIKNDESIKIKIKK